jgi:hypothetical protein
MAVIRSKKSSGKHGFSAEPSRISARFSAISFLLSFQEYSTMSGVVDAEDFSPKRSVRQSADGFAASAAHIQNHTVGFNIHMR